MITTIKAWKALQESQSPGKIYLLDPYKGAQKDFDNGSEFTGSLEGAIDAAKELLTKLKADRVAIIEDRTNALIEVVFPGENPYKDVQLSAGQVWVSAAGREFKIASIKNDMVTVPGGYRDSTADFILFLAEEGAKLKK